MYARIRSHAAPSGLFGPTSRASEAAEIGWAVDEAQQMRAENAKVTVNERECIVMMTVRVCATELIYYPGKKPDTAEYPGYYTGFRRPASQNRILPNIPTLSPILVARQLRGLAAAKIERAAGVAKAANRRDHRVLLPCRVGRVDIRFARH